MSLSVADKTRTWLARSTVPRLAALLGQRRLLLLPIVAYLLLFFLIPVGSLLALSFSGPDGPTLKLFGEVLARPAVGRILVTTLEISLVATLLAMVVAYPVAYYLTTLKGGILALAISLVVFPLLTSTIVRTYAWMTILRRVGVLNSLLLSAGLIETPLDLVFNRTGVYIGLVHLLMPFAILPIYSAMRGLDRNMLKAAASLGAGPVSVFVRVYLPLTIAGVTSGALLVFIIAIGSYITPAALGGNRDIMIANLIANEVQTTLNWPLAAVLSLLLLVVTLGILVAYFRVNERMSRGWVTST